jgi:flagellar motor switch protein FliG
MSEAGIHRAAVLMLALGQDEAAEVMKYLDPDEVHKLGRAMSTMKAVSSATLETVLERFVAETGRNTSFGVDSDEYIRAVLTKALGDDKAAALIKRILGTREASGIESLRWMEAKAVADLIRHEHPQIIATILVHLERLHASEVLSEFTPRLRNDVILRIATLDGVQPAALNELNDVLTKLLTGNDNLTKKAMGGTRATAEIMNFMSGEAENSVMENLKDFDTELAQQVKDQMFVFDNLLDIGDRDIQLILREVPSEGLIIALKGAREEMRDKIFRNMSQRAAEMMREDLEAKGPVRVSEVERQQKEILQIVRRLAEEGQIDLRGDRGEAYV